MTTPAQLRADPNRIAIAGIIKCLREGLPPAGSILAYGGTTAPDGWLACDGTSYLRTEYPGLFVDIGTAYGTADATHFNVPDGRGRFLRGQDQGAGRDPDAAGRAAMNAGGATGDNVGSVQTDAMQGHLHNNARSENNINAGVGYRFSGNTNPDGTNNTSVPVSDGTNGIPRTSSETRPVNFYVRYIIKT